MLRGLLLLTSISSTCSVSISLSQEALSGAPVVSPSLISLSIEQDLWTEWAGLDKRNEFFYNTLDNIAQISGQPPFVRIGANSADFANFNPALKAPQVEIPTTTIIVPAPGATVLMPYPETTKMVVGDSYYQAARFLPKNTHVSWAVNFAEKNLTAAVLQAKSIAEAFSSPEVKNAGIKLDFIELGNEVDIYIRNKVRPADYNISQYLAEWNPMAEKVAEVAEISERSHTKLLSGSFAFSTHTNNGSFSPQSLLGVGFLSSKAGRLVQSFTQHHYSGQLPPGSTETLQNLVTKAYIRSNLTEYLPDIDVVRSQGLDYWFSETNSFPLHGVPNVSNAAGTALWALDYSLFGRTIGISRMCFHGGIGYKYNLIQPATLTRSPNDGSDLPAPLPPHVQPMYYAAIIAAEAIGKSGNTKVTEISIENSRLSGYAFYEKEKLVRALFINSEGYFQSSTGARPKLRVDLPGMKGNVKVKRLAIKHTEDSGGLSWDGQSYETRDARPEGRLVVDTVAAKDGFDISATEVALVSFR